MSTEAQKKEQHNVTSQHGGYDVSYKDGLQFLQISCWCGKVTTFDNKLLNCFFCLKIYRRQPW